MLVALNLPPYQFRFRQIKGRQQIFDEIRKKFVTLTPEEWVRQNFVRYLQYDCLFPPTLIAIEMPVKVNGLNQRADIVVYNKKGEAAIIVECKAPTIPITNKIFDQAARYNYNLDVQYLMVTNGLQHYCVKLDHQNTSYQIVKQPPKFEELG